MSARKPLTAIPRGFGSGGAGLYPKGGSSTVASSPPFLEQLLNEHRSAILALQGTDGDEIRVRFATTASITLASTGLTAIDGVTPVAGDLALVKSQSTPGQNDIYVASASAWAAAVDDSGASLLKDGTLVAVGEGTVNGGKIFILGSDLTTWTAGTTASLSVATPVAVGGGVAGNAGVAATASKSDHIHAVTAASASVPGSMSAVDKALFDIDHQAAGTALTDTATQAVLVAAGYWRTLPTLGQGGAATISVTGAVLNAEMVITRTDESAFTYDVIDGGPGTPTLCTFPVSKKASARIKFNGTNWLLKEIGVN